MRIKRPVQLLVAPVLLGVLALTGCNDLDPQQAGVVAPAAGSQPDAPVDPSAPAAPSAPSAPSDDYDDYDEDRDAGADEEYYATQALWPTAQDSPVQGGSYGLVVLSAADQPSLEASQEQVAAYGYTATVAEIGCLQGAAEATGLPEGTLVSHLLFDTLDQAEQFATTAAENDVAVFGTAPVTAFCLD